MSIALGLTRRANSVLLGIFLCSLFDTSAGFVMPVNLALAQQAMPPSRIEVADDCAIAIQRYISFIDELMVPTQADALYATEALWRTLPNCQLSDKSVLLDKITMSKFLFERRDGEYAIGVGFRRQENDGYFEIGFSFDLSSRTIGFPFARYGKQ